MAAKEVLQNLLEVDPDAEVRIEGGAWVSVTEALKEADRAVRYDRAIENLIQVASNPDATMAEVEEAVGLLRAAK